MIWSILLVVYIAYLGLNAKMGDLGCERPVGSSIYGHASWQWWPPGTRCTYPASEFDAVPGGKTGIDEPPIASGIVALALIAVPLGYGALARRRRRPPADLEAATQRRP